MSEAEIWSITIAAPTGAFGITHPVKAIVDNNNAKHNNTLIA